MTDNEMWIAIAEACGWKRLKQTHYKHIFCIPGHECSDYPISQRDSVGYPPDYLNDLNAMHSAVMSLPDTDDDGSRHHYRLMLMEVCGASSAIDATARQRAEAFLRTIGKWKD